MFCAPRCAVATQLIAVPTLSSPARRSKGNLRGHLR